MEVKCKRIANASLDNVIYLQRLQKEYEEDIQKASNALLEDEKFKDDKEEILSMNKDMEALIEKHKTPEGYVDQSKSYLDGKKEIEEKYPRGAEYQKENMKVMVSIMNEEIDVRIMMVKLRDMADTVSGVEINKCSFMIDRTVIA